MIRVQNFATGVLAELIRRQPPSPARTRFAWQLAVGPQLARATTVELGGGTLTVVTQGPQWTAEIDRARETILARLHRLLGGEVREMIVRNP